MFKVISRCITVLLIALLLLNLTTLPVLAFDNRSGDTVTIAIGETIDEDLYLTGGDIIIDGTINGDLLGMSRTLTINGKVKGAVNFAAQTITMSSTSEIGRSARLAAQNINSTGKINGDLLTFASVVSITGVSRIGGDLFCGAGTARIEGNVAGNITGFVGEANLTNYVGGNINLATDKLSIASTADIKGNVTYTSDNEANIQPGARVSGKVIHELPETGKKAKEAPFKSIASTIWNKVLGFLMILVIGIVLLLLVPKRLTTLTEAIRTNLWQSLGWGALILFATPIAAIIVMCTVIGLPIGLITLALYGIALYLSQIPVALLTGRLIIMRSTQSESKGLLIGALALGLAIITILTIIPVLGFIVGLSIVLFGLGSIITSTARIRIETR